MLHNLVKHFLNKDLKDINGEIWENIKGVEDCYLVSNKGRIKSIKEAKSPIIISPFITPAGYLRIQLIVNKTKKKFFVHRLVAIHFKEKTEENTQVNHKNGIKWCNEDWNLEWCTGSENIKHAFRMGKKPNIPWRGKKGFDSIKGIRIIQYSQNMDKIAEYGSVLEAIEKKAGSSTIYLCLKGKAKLSGGYIWKYKT